MSESRRHHHRNNSFLFAALITIRLASIVLAELPVEPIEIGTEPQFLIDSYLVDNSWAIKYKRESVQRVFHQPKKFENNPVISGTGGYASVTKDERDGKFKMWYQISSIPSDKEDRSDVGIAYAESADGVRWTLPKLGLQEWLGNKQNNVVWTGLKGSKASGCFLLDVPEADRRGHRFVMLYHDFDGLRLIGSDDGTHWDKANNTHLKKLHSDTANSIVYDPRRHEFVMFCRAKHIYRTFQGNVLDTGESRRVARMTNKELWSEWTAEPQNILRPDEVDAERGFDCYYGMPTKWYGGMYWGFLWPFKTNTDIVTELTYSRDGIHFDRLPGRPRMIELGSEGSWDDGMVFGSASWIEVGDEWWSYYAGWDGPHGIRERTPGIGLIKVRKEGFVSVHGPANGGVLVTRQIKWPGGKLLVNAAASEGELKVRVTDARRKVIDGFDYDDCVPFTSDRVSHEITWKQNAIDSLAGQVIRFEFLLKNADLYSMRATGP